MAYTYTLLVLDDDGNEVLGHDLTADEAIRILAPHIGRKEEPEPEPEWEPVPVETTRRGPKPGKKQGSRTCKLCGKPGHNRKTCPAAGGSKPIARDKNAEPLTEDQFDQLKHLQDIGDLSSRDFAKEHGLALTEVNRAITSRTYQEYIDF